MTPSLSPASPLPWLFAVSLAALLALSAIALRAEPPSEPELLRLSAPSARTGLERAALVYLPRGYQQRASWPVLLFLHGNGERGDGQGELDYVTKHGPLFEAWAQKRDLPFIIVSPQLPMFDQGEVPYIRDRTPAEIPRRLPGAAVHPAPPHYTGKLPFEGQLAAAEVPAWAKGDERGWNTIADEVMALLDRVLAEHKGDPRRVYLTGLSYGGAGTWYLAWQHPERFAAIAPVVGYGHPDMAPALVAAQLPLWVFAGGRDEVVPVKYFYPLLNRLEALGHPDVRFTIEADMGHDTWTRVYGGEDLYRWFLAHTKE